MKRMSSRVWTWTVVVAVLIGGVLAAGRASGLRAVMMRSPHSRPAARLPSTPVAVTAAGKTFHDPRCTFIHGTPTLMSAEAAERAGYTPCVRCMKEYLHP